MLLWAISPDSCLDGNTLRVFFFKKHSLVCKNYHVIEGVGRTQLFSGHPE